MNKREIKLINSAIDELVYDKVAIRKAYQYYHCQRDAEQFKHLEDNYGVGSPTSVAFTPLIKKHIDVLVGKYLELDQEVKVTCKDSDTVANILREKQLKIDHAVFTHLKQHVMNNIIGALLEDKEAVSDPLLEQQLENIKRDIDTNFISEYEIAAQNILQYIKQSRNIDLKSKLKLIFIDLLISGLAYYRTRPTESGTNISFERLNPLDTFVEKNVNSDYLADSRRAVIRKYMTKEMILNEYGADLTQEALKELEEMEGQSESTSQTYFVRLDHTPPADGVQRHDTRIRGILGGLEAHPGLPSQEKMRNASHLITVYEVEWLEVDKETKRLDRYEGVRIGESIYITRGKSENVVRSMDAPSKCRLSINGLFFLDNNGDPFSLMINTMSLQDKYDLLLYSRDNLIASSGTVGDWLDIAHLPTSLGATMPERIQKWLAYKKGAGVGLIDSSEEGQQMNTIFNGFDDTVKAQSIQAIQIAIQSVEQQASAITGVLPEMLAEYSQRDAVSNVKLGVTTSGLLTKQYFDALDTIYKEVNYDLLNLAKIVYKKGIQGMLILGDAQSKVFTALPEHFTITDYDVHIEDSSKSFQKMEYIKALNTELIKAGESDAELALHIATAPSVTHLKKYVSQAMKQKNEENNMMQQMQQQLQDAQQTVSSYEKQMKEMEDRIQHLQKTASDIEQARLQLDQRRFELEQEKIRNDKDYNDKMVDVKNKQVQVQIAQTADSNPYNDKIQKVI